MKCLGAATIKIVIVICVDYIKLVNDFQADISITCPSFIATFLRDYFNIIKWNEFLPYKITTHVFLWRSGMVDLALMVAYVQPWVTVSLLALYAILLRLPRMFVIKDIRSEL
jgi:hypothetical protein